MDNNQREFRTEVIEILRNSGKYNGVREFSDDRIGVRFKNNDREFTLRIGELNGY